MISHSSPPVVVEVLSSVPVVVVEVVIVEVPVSGSTVVVDCVVDAVALDVFDVLELDVSVLVVELLSLVDVSLAVALSSSPAGQASIGTQNNE